MKLSITKDIADTDNTERNQLNYAQALRQLKYADAMLEKRKKQLKVRAIRAQKGAWVQQDHQQKQHLRKQIKATTEKLQGQLSSIRLKQMQRIEQYKKRSQQYKLESFKNRQKSRLQALQNRLRAKHQVRLKSLEHQQKIKNIHNDTFQRRKSLCQDIYNSRKLSKLHFDSFQQSRIVEVRRVQSRERDDLIQRLKMRQQQLNHLDESSSLLSPLDKHQNSTADVTSLRKSQLRQQGYASSYLKKRKKSNSQSKMDVSRHQLLILS